MSDRLKYMIHDKRPKQPDPAVFSAGILVAFSATRATRATAKGLQTASEGHDDDGQRATAKRPPRPRGPRDPGYRTAVRIDIIIHGYVELYYVNRTAVLAPFSLEQTFGTDVLGENRVPGSARAISFLLPKFLSCEGDILKVYISDRPVNFQEPPHIPYIPDDGRSKGIITWHVNHYIPRI